MNEQIQLNIKGISYSQTQTGAYALILEEENGSRKLPIVIGSLEAQSIALALEKDIRPPRPLTHDLFVSVAEQYNLEVVYVIIHKLEDGVFYSNIHFVDANGEESIIDSRTSDAIALAVRFQSPIYAMNSVMEKAGIYLQESEKDKLTVEKTIQEIEDEVEESENTNLNWESKPNSELEKLLDEAVDSEDYELAARIRDEIDKRKEEL